MALTVKQIERETVVGRYFDGVGDGMVLTIRKRGDKLEKSFSIRYKSPETGKPREKGLGSFPKTSLQEARDKAKELRIMIDKGIDPLESPSPTGYADGITFAMATSALIETKRSGWKNAKHASQWENTLATYGKPINHKLVSAVTRDDVVRCLSEIWITKPETASRVRSRIASVLEYAMAKGWRQDELNPAEMNSRLEALLPNQKKKSARIKHHPALHWKKLPDFMADLQLREGIASRMLEFTILTALRTSEVKGALWSEISKDKSVWKVSANRMKMGVAHSVPLSTQAKAILEGQSLLREDNPLVFLNDDLEEHSENAMLALLKRMERTDITVHGFRSTFRDWAEENGWSHNLSEMALAHSIKGVEGAYRRGDLLEQRLPMMQAYADFAFSKRVKKKK